MAIARKALFWSLFAAGGSLTALLFPALIALFLLAASGYQMEGLDHAAAQAFASAWTGKAVLFFIVGLSLWHAAHRLRVLCHDLGLRADGGVAVAVYLAAGLGTILAGVFLAMIR